MLAGPPVFFPRGTSYSSFWKPLLSMLSGRYCSSSAPFVSLMLPGQGWSHCHSPSLWYFRGRGRVFPVLPLPILPCWIHENFKSWAFTIWTHDWLIIPNTSFLSCHPKRYHVRESLAQYTSVIQTLAIFLSREGPSGFSGPMWKEKYPAEVIVGYNEVIMLISSINKWKEEAKSDVSCHPPTKPEIFIFTKFIFTSR